MTTETLSPPFFSQKELEVVQKKPLPKHIALIMDGNRRWAQKNKFSQLKSTFEGHNQGALALVRIIQAAKEVGIETLTVYGFSTENRSRSLQEVQTIYKIIESYLKNHLSQMLDEGIRFNYIGDISPFPPPLKEIVLQAKEKTGKHSSLVLNLALNYGSRDEITRAVKKIAKKIEAKKLHIDDINEDLISSHLDTEEMGDPDLLIRTSGEMRLSNFLLWQLAYSEIFVTKTLWPDFHPFEFLKAILDFQERERRIGK